MTGRIEGLQEPGGRGAVHDAMVERQAQRHLIADDDLVLVHHGASPDPAHAEDGALRDS